MPTDIRRYAAELVALAPDVILAYWRLDRGAVAAGDPHRADRVRASSPIRSAPASSTSLARPGGNATGFMHVRIRHRAGNGWSCSKRSRRGVTRAAVLRDPTLPAGIGQFAAIQAVAPSFGVEVSPVDVRDAAEIERAVTAFARAPNGGLIVTASASAIVHRDLIIALAARHRLPAVYSDRFFVTAGGLISYGPDLHRPVPARGRLRRSHPQGREAGRPAGAGADQVRAGDQPQDRQGARPRRAADAARPRRRGDRMSAPGKAGAIQPVEVRPK